MKIKMKIVSLHPGMGAMHFLPSLIGNQNALKLLLTGEVISGTEAENIYFFILSFKLIRNKYENCICTHVFFGSKMKRKEKAFLCLFIFYFFYDYYYLISFYVHSYFISASDSI